MSAIDTDFGFDAVFRKSAAELKVRLARDVTLAGAPLLPGKSLTRRTWGASAAFVIFAALGLLSVGIFAIGYSAFQSDEPNIWIHRLMALAIAQSILIGAIAMKLLPIIKRRPFLIGIGANSGLPKALSATGKGASLSRDSVPPPLPEPRKPTVGGQLAGRDFMEYDDGSVEIDTLVGRRRFVSLGAAREFVGS